MQAPPLLSFILLCFISAISADFVQWDCTSLDQLVGKNIRIEIIYDDYYYPPKDKNPHRWVFPSLDWPHWERKVLAGTTNQNEKTSFQILSVVAQTFYTPANPYTQYRYEGWKIKLKNVDYNENVYWWHTNLQTGTDAAQEIIFATKTYDPWVTLACPLFWMIRADTYYPNGVRGGGLSSLLTAQQPIGHFSWTDYNMKNAATYRLWVETPTPPPPAQTTGDIVIWKCTAPGVVSYLDPAVIRMLAQTATSITIFQNNDPTQYVTTVSSNSYALDSLRLGKTLSYTPLGGYAISSDWTGPKLSTMWNSCGWTADFQKTAYWACNNGNGLHIGDTTCGWDSSANTPGGISIKITRNTQDPLIPIWRCIGYGQNIPLLTTPAAVMAIGRQTTSITIYSTLNSAAEYVTTASSSVPAIVSLQNDKPLDHSISGSGSVSSDWTGTKTSNVGGVTCNGSPTTDFIHHPFWACNNGGGLHITHNVCSWTSGGTTPTGGISVGVKLSTPISERIVRIWSCTGSGSYSQDYTMSAIQQLAQSASGVLIMSRNNPEEYVFAGANSKALNSLKIGKSLSFGTNGEYTSTTDWTGTKTDQMWNGCGSPQPFDQNPYWACNNGNGLHLSTSICGWTSAGSPPTGGIGVYLYLPYSVPGVVFTEIDESPLISHTQANTPLTQNNLPIIIGASVGSVMFVIILVVIIVVVVKRRTQSLNDDVVVELGAPLM